MNKRVKNAIIGTFVYVVIAFIVSYIVEGEPVWNLVISSGIAGFLLYAYILPRMEKRRLEKNKEERKSI